MTDSNASKPVGKTDNRTGIILRRWIFPAVCLTAALLIVAYLLLPRAAERLVLPQLFAAADIQDYDFPVRKLGLFGLHAGALRIGPASAPGITVLSLSAAYDPGDLLRRRIDRLTLSGVRIRVRVGEEGLSIPGLPLSAVGTEETRGPAEAPPVTVGSILVEHGEILIERNGEHLRLPFEAAVTTASAMTTLEGILKLALTDRWLNVNARADLTANRLTAEWEGKGIRLGLLGRRAGLTRWLHISGIGETSGHLQARLTPLTVDRLEAAFRHTPCRLNWKAMRLDLAGGSGSEDMALHVTKTEADNWTISTSPVRVSVPGGAGLFQLDGSLAPKEAVGLTWEGRLSSVLAIEPVDAGRPGFSLQAVFQSRARIGPEGGWQIDLEQAAGSRPDADPAITTQSRLTPIELRTFETTIEGRGASISASARWRVAALETEMGALRVAVDAVEGNARYETTEGAGKGRLELRLGAVAVRGGGLDTRVDAVTIEADSAVAPETTPALAGAIVVRGGRARIPDAAVAAEGLHARLPLSWPLPEKGPPGDFTLKAVAWEGKSLGAVTGRLWQTANGLGFDARHANRLVPALNVAADGAAKIDPGSGRLDAHVRWTAERSPGAPPLALSNLMPDPPEFPITFSGRLFAKGEMVYRGGLGGFLTAGVDAGRLQVDEQGLVIEGLATELHIPDIGRMRSAPGQHLGFKAFTFGSIRAEDGRLDYQIEPGSILFLEGGRFRWCGGSVIVPASRFVSGKNRYDITLFCDRLKLDRLLEQFGLAKVEGGGAISGLIPVALDRGRLIFDNAFLYSTPGEGGIIRVQGSEVLTAGIPAGTPSYNQMELARHALKDYDYQWAKITMNTVEDDLRVQLQFDGKPAEPLPFVYDPAFGGFVKTDPGQPGSVFQGIRLDVNVTLPLNRILRYRELFKQLQ